MTSSQNLSKEVITINEKVVNILNFTNKEIKEFHEEVANMNSDSTNEIRKCWSNNFYSCEDYLKDFSYISNNKYKIDKMTLASSLYTLSIILLVIWF